MDINTLTEANEVVGLDKNGFTASSRLAVANIVHKVRNRQIERNMSLRRVKTVKKTWTTMTTRCLCYGKLLHGAQKSTATKDLPASPMALLHCVLSRFHLRPPFYGPRPRSHQFPTSPARSLERRGDAGSATTRPSFVGGPHLFAPITSAQSQACVVTLMSHSCSFFNATTTYLCHPVFDIP